MSKKLIVAVLLGILCGCSGIDHDSRKELSETFVAAIAQGDEDQVWDAFAPSIRENLLAMYGDDEEKAKSELLKNLQQGLKKRYEISDFEDFMESKKFKTAVKTLMSSSSENFVQQDDKWYLSVDLSK